jgi:O-methyltransferase involved in polyketide biosynthesis
VSPGSAISPTAHYTGYVWARNGLSHPELVTREGRLLFDVVRPLNMLSARVGGPTLEAYLLARHRALDTLLERAIDDGGVTQVVEVASGLSPRGWRFSTRYGDRLTYVEADLPAMADRKRRALARMGSLSERHRVDELDALRDSGPGSLAALTATLDRGQGLAIVTEGLLSYLGRDDVDHMWRRFALELGRFRAGRYLADIGLGGGGGLAGPYVKVFMLGLSAFVRGRVNLHFPDAADAAAALEEAGFAHAEVRPAAEVVSFGDAHDPGVRAAHVAEAVAQSASSSRNGSDSSP